MAWLPCAGLCHPHQNKAPRWGRLTCRKALGSWDGAGLPSSGRPACVPGTSRSPGQRTQAQRAQGRGPGVADTQCSRAAELLGPGPVLRLYVCSRLVCTAPAPLQMRGALCRRLGCCGLHGHPCSAHAQAGSSVYVPRWTPALATPSEGPALPEPWPWWGGLCRGRRGSQ